MKTIIIFALLALALTQDVSQAVDAANDAANVANNAAGSVTVGQVVEDPLGVVESVAGTTEVDVDQLPTLNSVTVGWGPKSVEITPVNPNPTNSDWLNNGELLDVERASTDAADGEWALNWSVEDGNDWALWDVNGDLVIVDWVNGESNVVANLGNQPGLDAEIGAGAEAIVDAAWNSETDQINTADLVEPVNNLVNSIWNNVNLQGFLSQNSGNTVGSVVGEVVNNVGNDVSGAVDQAQSAVAGAV